MQRQRRILDTLQGKRTDRTPLLFSGDSAMMRYVNPDATFYDMITDHEALTEIIITDFLPKFPKIDYLQAVGMNSRNMGAGQMARMYLPGRELPKNEMWQLVFSDIMTEDDYDFILKNGWAKFNTECIFKRLGYDPDSMREDMEEGGRNARRFHDAGFPFQLGGMFPETLDLLAFGRGLMNFYVDIYEYGDEILEILDIMLEEFENEWGPRVKSAVDSAAERGEKVFYAVQPGVQANCNLVSRDIFEKFAWPSYKRQAELVIKNGGYVYFHMDCNWTGFLDFFKDFPKGRCLFDTDGFTELEKVRDTLSGTMGFTGNVPPAVMAFGTPEENYRTVKRQIEEMGDSFIAAPSCSLPPNMPRENLEAMYAAIDEQ